MRSLLLALTLLLICTAPTFSQRLEKFSDDPQEFLRELKGYLTAGKLQSTEEVFDQFDTYFKSGVFSPEEIAQIQQTGNAMLGQRMTAQPYFRDYLRCLNVVKNAENGAERFREWHALADQMLADIENRRVGPFQDFLEFSVDFFSQNALRASDSGINWIVNAKDYQFVYRDRMPVVEFSKLDLLGIRKEDSIAILDTQGDFFPTEALWKGKSGRVTWERFDLGAGVYAELGDYEIETKKSLYRVETAWLHYPLFFGDRKVEGSFEDKVISANPATEGSYPRFESRESVLEIDNIGRGIRYVGGFRLYGTTVYGYGTKNNGALIRIFDESDQLKLKASSELFTIRRGERIVGERVECAIYFGKDSLYHPSVNFRFEIPKSELQLSRGDRASDRNPFLSSMHQVNIEADKINYYIDRDSIAFGEKSLAISKRRSPVVFESLNYFEESDYNRLQNIATFNPIAVIKAVSEKDGTRFLNANDLAYRLDSRFTVENIQSLLYDLVSKGFINYDSDEQEVEVKEKIFHYANASQKKVDYDVLRIESETSETNAIFNLKDNSITADGVENIVFSGYQKVALKPFGNQVILRENRDLDFDGRLFAGYGVLTGKNFHFKYDKFHILLDSVRFFDLYLPSEQLDENGRPVAYSIGSRIEHLNGVLLIDAPSNKSARDEIPMFPSLQSKKYSYVYYDRDSTQRGAYGRDSFYFRLEPFSFNNLDNFEKDALSFKGTLFSAGIFPDLQETLTLQDHDQSLGFVTNTVEEGYDNYQGKGAYKGDISLSNRGLEGDGTLSYLGASISSEDIVFKPKQLTASAKSFDLQEDRSGAVEVPKATGVDVSIDWRPYKDSMYISSKEAPFELFQEGVHNLQGTLILTPGGVKARGLFSWDKASMESPLFSFGANSVTADTTDLKVKAFNTEALALVTSNLNGVVDFDKQMASFEANEEFLRTTLPFNKYETSMNEFDWNMKEESIIFNTEEGKIGSFLSIQNDQDSLWFNGKTAEFFLKTNELKIGGVPYIVSADAYLYSEDSTVTIRPGGIMDTLYNARIVADTVNQFHVINRATVAVKGKKDFTATGFYEYNIGEQEQEIAFSNIVGQRVGKGAASEKRVATRATGEVKPEDNFYIDHKTEFRGTISLFSETKNLQFDGFARLKADLPNLHWFSVNFEGDKSDLAIRFDEPKNYQGEPLFTGLYLSRETARIYPRIMAPLYFRKDRQLLPVKGLFQYDQEKDRFIFGDSTKVSTPGHLKGNQVIFHNKTGKIEAEGRFNIGEGLKYIKVDAAGYAETKIEEIEADTLSGGPIVDNNLQVELMAGIELIVPEELLKLIITDFRSSSFDAQSVVYASNPNFYRKATAELFPEDKEMQRVLDGISLNTFDLPKKFNNYTFLFSRIPMKWDVDYQSFVSTQSVMPLASIQGELINRMVTCYVEFKMPTNDDDRLYIYLRSPSGFYYFFGFKQGILNMVSNNTKFNDLVVGMKDKERIRKMPDGQTYEIQPVDPGTASAFVKRVQAAND